MKRLIAILIVFVILIIKPVYSENIYNEIEKFNEVLSIVKSFYVEEKDAEEIIDKAIEGMLRSLDPYSVYMKPEQHKKFKESIEEKFFGVGMTVGIRDKVLTVISPLEGTPAQRAGLLAGDKILKVNGEDTRNLTLEQAVKKIKGPKGTKVILGIFREGEASLKDVEIIRDKIELKSVPYSFMIEEEIGYIRIVSFGMDTNDELEEALKRLEKDGMKKLILDLRGNPGGLLPQAVQITSKFLEGRKLIVYTKGRLPSFNKEYFCNNSTEAREIPLIILVNRGSASASEIFSGAIQDWDRGLIIGERTFGKGSVQHIFNLNRAKDESALKLTIASYYIPSGRCIHKETASTNTNAYKTSGGRLVYGGGGIKPDIAVTNSRITSFSWSLEAKAMFFGFSVDYRNENNPGEDFTADDQVILKFKDYLNKKEFKYKEEDITENIDYIKASIEREILTMVKNRTVGYRVQLKNDRVVDRAIKIFNGDYKIDTKLSKILEN